MTQSNQDQLDTYTCRHCGGLYHGVIACPAVIDWGKDFMSKTYNPDNIGDQIKRIRAKRFSGEDWPHPDDFNIIPPTSPNPSPSKDIPVIEGQPPTDKAVTEWMESHGFRKEKIRQYWILPDSVPQLSVDDQQALFFYTICQKARQDGYKAGATADKRTVEDICQKAEREARIDENNTAFLRILRVGTVNGLTAQELIKYHDNREAEINEQLSQPIKEENS